MDAGDPRAALMALVAGSEGETLASLSRLIGRNAAYLHQFVHRGTPRRLAEEDRRLLSRYFGVPESRLGGAAEDAPVRVRVRQLDARVRVRRLDARASAGPGALNDGEEVVGGVDFSPAMLRALGVRGGPVALIEARGTSMAPGIADGDQLLVDAGDTRVTARGGVFVIRADGAVMVKRVRRRAGRLEVTSDAPDAPPVCAEGIEVIGRVVWQSRAVR